MFLSVKFTLLIVESVEAASGSMKRTQNHIFPAGRPSEAVHSSPAPGSFNVIPLNVIVLPSSVISTV
jgi:hypothetical protein